ncbi:MAG: hypothetical protein ACTTJV_07835, partial [Ottowia sp.]
HCIQAQHHLSEKCITRSKVLAGSFNPNGVAQFINGQFIMTPPGRLKGEKIPATEILKLEVASEENTKGFLGAVGGGLVGGFFLGGVGMLAGLLAGGRGKIVTFVLEFKDGRKILGQADRGMFEKIHAAFFQNSVVIQPSSHENGTSAEDIQNQKKGWIIIVCVFAVFFLWKCRGSSGDASPHSTQPPSASLPATQAENKKDVFRIPSDPTGVYKILDIYQENKNANVQITTRRAGKSGTSYSAREYDCQRNMVRYLADGNTLEELKVPKPGEWAAIVDGSIAAYIGERACKK